MNGLKIIENTTYKKQISYFNHFKTRIYEKGIPLFFPYSIKEYQWNNIKNNIKDIIYRRN